MSFSYITMKDPTKENHRAQSRGNRSVPIGLVSNRKTIGAMVVAPDTKGVWRFVRELDIVEIEDNRTMPKTKSQDAPAMVCLSWLFDKKNKKLSVEIDKDSPSYDFFKTDEIIIKDSKNGVNSALMVCKYPYTREDVAYLKLRTSYQKKKASDNPILLELGKKSKEDALEFLEDQPYDFWQNSSGIYSAYSFGFGHSKDKKQDGRVYGICLDHNKALADIIYSQDYKNFVKERYTLKAVKKGSTQKTGKKVSTKTKLNRVNCFTFRIEFDARWKVLFKQAIALALAGPLQAEGMEGKKVIDYAKTIFDWLLYEELRKSDEKYKRIDNMEIDNVADQNDYGTGDYEYSYEIEDIISKMSKLEWEVMMRLKASNNDLEIIEELNISETELITIKDKIYSFIINGK